MKNLAKYSGSAAHSQNSSALSLFDGDVSYKKLGKLKSKHEHRFTGKRGCSFALAGKRQMLMVWRKSHYYRRDTAAHLFIGVTLKNTKSANYDARRGAA